MCFLHHENTENKPDYFDEYLIRATANKEYLVHRLVAQLNQMSNSHVIFQWPVPDRFDKLVENLINVYGFQIQYENEDPKARTDTQLFC